MSLRSIVGAFVFAAALFMVSASAHAQSFELANDELVVPPVPAARPLRIALSAVSTSFVALQALDTVTTLRGITGGAAVEANPLVGGLTNHPAAFVALKGGLTAATVLSVHSISNRHPKAALWTMVALNAASAFVVRSNVSITLSR